MNVEALLPKAAKPFSKALAAAFSDTLPVPIEQIMDPGTTPVEWLPWLGAHRGVKLWYADWNEARKRQMVEEAPELAALSGTRAAAARYLGYVDATVVDIISYPAHFVMGRSAFGITPIGHPPFKARYLVKITLKRPVNSFIMGRSAIGQAAFRKVDLEPVHRVKQALRVAKAEESEYLISFAWRRGLTFGDAVPIDGQFTFGDYVDRQHL